MLAQALRRAGATRRTIRRIVNIVDQRVLKLTPQNFSYTLTKAALHAATTTMAQALAPAIRVNAVGPGPTAPNVHDGEAGMAREVAGVPLGARRARRATSPTPCSISPARAP